MTDITWTNTTIKLSRLKPWADNPKRQRCDEDIPVIRGMIKSGNSLRFIARKFNVSAGTIHYIKNGKTWTHV